MVKKLLLPLLVFLLLPVNSPPVIQATQQASAVQESVVVDKKQLDKRAEILRNYLQTYDSPLQYHAQDFVDAADKNNIDWRLVPAIAGVESTFGKFTPGGYNAWGWGVYGDQALGFDSWTEAIFTVTHGLRVGYFDKGLTEPLAINRVYAASPTWGIKVNYFLHDLDLFTKEYESKAPQESKTLLHKTVETSAQLAYKN